MHNMGSSLQRIEVLLIGLVLLIAGAVVASLTLLRPAAPTSYLQATPQPITTRVASQPSSVQATAANSALAIPSAAPLQLPMTVPVTIAPPVPTSIPIVTNAPTPILTIPLVVQSILPWVLLAGGIGGGGWLGLRIRKRRMTYTNQNLGQLLAVADRVTRETNLRVMQGLADQGMLTEELAAAAGIKLKQLHH